MNNQAVTERTVKLGRGLCLTGAGLGALGVLGWLVGAEALFTIVPGQPPMMPNTAFGLLLLGVAATSRHAKHSGGTARWLSLSAAAIVLAVGLGTIAEYALGLEAGLDQLFIRSQVGPYPGRPSPPSALALTFLATAILFVDSRPAERTRLSEWLILSAGLIAVTALLGQLFGAGPLYRLAQARVIGVAVPTALSLLMISVGLLLERPDAGVLRIVTAPGPGGVLLRRLALTAILVPVGFALVAARLLEIEAADVGLVFAALTVVATAASLFLLVITAEHLNREHDALEQSRRRAQDLIEQASEGVFISDLEGRFVDVNAVGCRMAGYSREEILGKAIADLIPPEDVERLRSHRAKLIEGSTDIGEWALRRKDGSDLPVEVSAKILPDGRWQAFSRDISERKRAEEQIREAQERFELALKGANLGSWDWDIMTGEVISNPRCAEMRGFRPEEIRSHVDAYIAGIHPEDLPAFQRALGDCLEGVRSGFECEYRASTKSGAWVWILSQGKVFGRDERGRPIRMVGTALDITARKHADEEVRLSEAKFAGIVSISTDAIISIDDDHRIILFNEGAEKIFGYLKAEVTGSPLEILVPERFRANHRRGVQSFAAGPNGARQLGGRGAPIFGVRKNGEEFPADAAISKIAINGKHILTVSLRDITEQEQAAAEHRSLDELGAVFAVTLEFEDRLTNLAQLLVRDLADLCIIDVIEDDGSIRRAKVACRNPIMGWVCDAFMRSPADGERPRMEEPVLQGGLIQKVTPDVIRSWTRTDEECTALQRAGFRSAISTPLMAHGKALGTLLLLSNSRVYGPADLHMTEAIARRASLLLDNVRLFGAAKRAIQSRDEILGIVAHDLRNPLAAIITLADVLKRGAEHEIGEEIKDAGDRMSRLIQDLIDVTHIESGRLTLRLERLKAAEAASDSLEPMKTFASLASLKLRVDVSPDLPDISVERDRLLQVFENLVGNAIKFTRPGGQITVGAMAQDNEILFSVADTGCGIASNYLPHVFDRFWRVPGASHRGAGLGLAIVKGIVEAHRGRVWVQSTPGQGSTFFFTIPTAQPGQSHSERPAARQELPPRQA